MMEFTLDKENKTANSETRSKDYKWSRWPTFNNRRLHFHRIHWDVKLRRFVTMKMLKTLLVAEDF